MLTVKYIRLPHTVKKLIGRVLLIIMALGMAAAQAFPQTSVIGAGQLNDAGSWQQQRINFITNGNGYLTDTSTYYDTDVISRNVDGLYPECGDMSLSFTVKCGYDNSSVNNFLIYIIANGPDPQDSLFRGFAIGTGFRPNYKALSLIYNEGGDITVLANTGINIGRTLRQLKVCRSSMGVWSVDDAEIYTEPIPRFHLADHLIAAFSFTRTGAGNLQIRFDDFSRTEKTAQIKPRIDSALVVDPNTIRIYHNARLNPESAADISHYSVNGVHPIKAVHQFYFTDITFSDLREAAGRDIALSVNGLADCGGVPVPEYRQILHQAGYQQIVINEIMVDLSPAPFALPKAKYVELWNASASAFRLDGYTFAVGDYIYQIPDMELHGGEYLILCANDTSFARYGKFANILQESRLTVSPRTVVLRNKLGCVVDSLTYSDRMYNDPSRRYGGYSMERRDPYNNCTGTANWQASTDLSGGTPGRQNSQYSIYVDNTIPRLIGCQAITPTRFSMQFSEPVQGVTAALNGGATIPASHIDGAGAIVEFPQALSNGANTITISPVDVCGTQGAGYTVSISYLPFRMESVYAISPYQLLMNFSTGLADMGTDNFRLSDGQIPILAEYTSDGRSSILLTFADDFISGKKYSVTVSGLRNQLQELIDRRDFQFRYHAPQYGDVVINEIMYYPNAGAKRYVELYNRSGADVFPFGFQLRHYTADGNTMKAALCTSHHMLEDGGYAVLCADTLAVAEYYSAAEGSLYMCPQMPALNTSKGYVVLASADGVTLDSVYYEKSMHSTIIQNIRGVALERVDVEGGSLDAQNWTSAQSGYYYATPGFRNSVSWGSESDRPDGNNGNIPVQELSMENQLLRPGDADRQLMITLNIPRADVCVSATVYDDNGRPMRNLVTQEMIYPGYQLFWDGIGDHGSICKAGMYVVLIKAWDPTGWTHNYKLVCVVGTGR